MKQELIATDSEYDKLLSRIDEVWDTAKNNAALAVIYEEVIYIFPKKCDIVTPIDMEPLL